MALVPMKNGRSQTPAYRGGMDDFDRVFDNFFRNALTNLTSEGPSVTGMSVRMDVSETDKAYHIKADLPGLNEKDIELTFDDGMLKLSGEKETEQVEDGKTIHRVERSYGRFTRSLQLPADADASKIKAQMKNGVLEIDISKQPHAAKKSQRIAIRSA